MNIIEAVQQLRSAANPFYIATREDAPLRSFRILWENTASPRARIEHLYREIIDNYWEIDPQTNFSLADLISNKWNIEWGEPR